MLPITIEGAEYYDEIKKEFVNLKSTKLQLEHSLVSVSKWESKWHKSFIDNIDKLTPEELISYIECMNMTQNVDPDVFQHLSVKNLNDIMEYIQNPMTATTITSRDPNQSHKKQIITSELIYCWMFAQGIPKECEKWHLNRLMMLIRVCAITNSPSKKMSKAEAMNQHRADMAKARAKYKKR